MYHLFLIIAHWSYFKCIDLLHTSNVYKIPEKEQEIAAELQMKYQFKNVVLEILITCLPNIIKLQKTNERKNSQIQNFFYFKCAINLSDNFRIICRKNIVPLDITFLHKFLYRVTSGVWKACFNGKSHKWLICRKRLLKREENNSLIWHVC